MSRLLFFCCLILCHVAAPSAMAQVTGVTHDPGFVSTETIVTLEIPKEEPDAGDDDKPAKKSSRKKPTIHRFPVTIRTPHSLAQDVLMHIDSPLSKKAELILWPEAVEDPVLPLGKRFDTVDILVIDEAGSVMETMENINLRDMETLAFTGNVRALLLFGPGTVTLYNILPGTKVKNPALE